MMSTALLVIDPYNDFIAARGKIWPYLREVAERLQAVPNMRALVTAARKASMQVVFVPHRQFRPGDLEGWKFLNLTHAGARKLQPFSFGSWGAEFHEDFQPREGDILVQEHWLHSGFAATDLDYRLRMKGIDRIVLCGMRANTCIEGTARWGVELGYHVTIASDATAAFRWEEWVATIETNAPVYAHEILRTEAIVRSWGDAPVIAA
jgi:nicotinamidase-related amidase